MIHVWNLNVLHSINQPVNIFSDKMYKFSYNMKHNKEILT